MSLEKVHHLLIPGLPEPQATLAFLKYFNLVPVVRVKTLKRLVSYGNYIYCYVGVNVVSYISGQTLRLSPVSTCCLSDGAEFRHYQVILCI